MPAVKELITDKSRQVFCTSESATVLEAAREMSEHHIGCLVVCGDDGSITGVFSERDVISRVVVAGRDPAQTTIGSVLTRDVICVGLDTDVDDAQAIMRDQRVRHLPVVDAQGRLEAIISIGDLNAYFARRGEVTIRYLSDYIYGRV